MKPPKSWWSQTWKLVASWHPKTKSDREWKQEITKQVSKIWSELPLQVKESIVIGSVRVKSELPCPKCGQANPISKTNVTLKCRGCGKSLIAVKVKGR